MKWDQMKKLSISEFIDSGLLQEVNRLFFHPRGLALTVEGPDDGEEGEWKLAGIRDERDEPEGLIFADGPDVDKAERVREAFEMRSGARLARLGYIIQPVPGETKE